MIALIEQFVLAVPGLAARDARDLSQRIARKLEAGLPDTFHPVLPGQLRVKVEVPRGLGLEELADRVSRAILERIKPGAGS